MTYTTEIHALPAPDQLPPDVGPDVPADIKALADALDPKLTPYSQGNGTPDDLGIAPGKPGRRHENLLTGDEYLDNGAAWVLKTPQINPAANVAGLRTLGTGALEAAAGNDPRLSDDRTPIDLSVDAAKIAASLKPSGGAAAATEALRALGVVAGTAAAGNDSRLSDQRVPTANSVDNTKVADGALNPAKIAGVAVITTDTRLTDRDPDLNNLQHGVVTGGVVTRTDATHVHVTAGKAWVMQASGLLRPVTWAATDLTIPVPAAGLRRVDQAVVDSAGNVTRLAGTAEGAGYTLDARNNAAAVPVGSLRFSDVLTIQTDGGLLSTANNVRDRRAWAKGLHAVGTMAAGGSVVLNNTAYTLIDASLTMRVETSGAPLEIALLVTSFQDSANAGANVEVDFYIDGVAQLGLSRFIWGESASQNIDGGGDMKILLGVGPNSIAAPAAGSHIIEPRYRVTNWNWNIGGKSQFLVRELLQVPSNNGTA